MVGTFGRERDCDEHHGWSAREIAQRNRAGVGQPLSPVMKTAATACELARNAAERDRG
jgi:hypothetical protein